MRFKEFIKFTEQNTVGAHNDYASGAFVSSNISGSEQTPNMQGHPLHLPSTDLQIPHVSKTGVIKQLELNKNPIFIMLSDGTRIYLTLDEFNRIQGKKPEQGRQMTVTFLRNPTDQSQNTSQIQSITVH